MSGVLCEKECTNEATTRYRWAWGEEGLVCDHHRAGLEGISHQLGRTITFVSLVEAPKAAPDPSVADLLVQVKIANAALQEVRRECDMAHAQNIELSNEVQRLRRELMVKGS